MKFVKFPNGNVWAVDDSGWITGSIPTPAADDYESSLESFLDKVAEAVTGSTGGLTDFSYQRNGSVTSFVGAAEELPDNEAEYEEHDFMLLDPNSDELWVQLAEQYKLEQLEVDHARTHLDVQYDKERVLALVNSHRSIHVAEDGSYVRVVVGGLFEVAYWDQAEWREAPAEVMSALVGAALGGIAS